MKREKEKLSKGAASGMVALVFLVLGFQLAIFVVKVVERPPRAEDAWSEPGMTERSEVVAGVGPGMTEKWAGHYLVQVRCDLVYQSYALK